jgi:hypothetical protein
MLPSHTFACLTSDIIRSRAVPDREALQAQIEDALAEANRRLARAFVVSLAVTLGDEWQGLLRSPDAAYEADFFLRGRLHPIALASGLGLGGVSTPIKARTADMDGVCFHRSREALERAKKRRVPGVVLLSGEPLVDAPANAVGLLLAAVSGGWTQKQFRSVTAYRELGTETAAAEALAVSQVTLHKSLAASRGKEFIEAMDALQAFLRDYPFPDSAVGRAP